MIVVGGAGLQFADNAGDGAVDQALLKPVLGVSPAEPKLPADRVASRAARG
jgi:hypothetical protein